MKQYYYTDGLEKHGPFSLEELRVQKISRNTMVWHYPLEKWLPAQQFPELQDLFAHEPPPMEPSTKFEVPNTAPGSLPLEGMPRTWLVESILVTFFCCMPFGIAGIVNAAKVETRYNSGDLEGARRSSSEAGKWTKIGFWITIAGIMIYATFMALLVAFDHH